MANFYFLCLTVMECYPPISDANGKPVLLMPLSFVVGVSMIKDGFEDYKRKKADADENRRPAKSAPRGGSEFKDMNSESIAVGTIVKVEDG